MLDIEYKYLVIITCVIFGMLVDDSYKFEHLSANPIIVGKDVKIQGNLTVTGDINSQNSIASNNMTCNSLSATNNLITPSAKVQGDLNVTGNINSQNSTASNTMTCKSLSATTDLTTPYAKIGQFNIRNKQIGIPGNHANNNFGYDMNFGNDGWIRHVLYDKDAQWTENNYVSNTGFASAVLWKRNW